MPRTVHPSAHLGSFATSVRSTPSARPGSGNDSTAAQLPRDSGAFRIAATRPRRSECVCAVAHDAMPMRVPLRTPNLRSVRDTPRFYAPPPTRVLRFANKAETTRYSGHFEVVALSGYLAQDEFHLHMAVSDGEGCTMGGHVMEGKRVYT